MKPLSLAAVALSGAMVGFGLAYSTLIQPEIVFNLLLRYDFGPLLTLGIASVIVLWVLEFVPRRMARPVLEPAFDAPPVPGAGAALAGALFAGAGWGLCGVGPDAVIAGLGAFNGRLWYAAVGMGAGFLMGGLLLRRRSG